MRSPGVGLPWWALSLGALGVVFGDIGTSVLYAMAAVFRFHGSTIDRSTVYGATSTLIWSLLLIVSLLYVGLVLRADNRGDGGLLALLALLRGRLRNRGIVKALTFVAMVGAATFLGDSLITPAISVLSAVEGLEIASPGLRSAVVPVALVVLAALFLLQPFGTGRIGWLFGPVMLLWFGALMLAGGSAIVRHPEVLQALSPVWAVRYFAEAPSAAFLSLGAIVLAVTGAEALYADLGHFGRPAIRRAWWLVVLPALATCYLGQAALMTQGSLSAGPTNPFFRLFPSWLTVPVVVLATAATIIASQAVISGAFTVVHQAAQLSMLPSVRTRHTSIAEVGQIYVPAVNWALAAGVIALVLLFQRSSRLAAAYGVAVTITVVATATLYLALRRSGWPDPPSQGAAHRTRRAAVSLLAVALLLVAIAFAAATAPKVGSGGWVPVTIALVVVLAMMSWSYGRARLAARLRELEWPVSRLAIRLRQQPPVVLPGTTVYVAHASDRVPLALVTALERDNAVHHTIVLLTWQTEDVPRVPASDQVRAQLLPGTGDVRVVSVAVRLGYDQRPWPQVLLRQAAHAHPDAFSEEEIARATYALSAPVAVLGRGRLHWRQRGYLLMSRLRASDSLLLDLPPNRTLLVGRRIEI